MKSSTMRADGTSMISPAFIPAMSFGTGFTLWGRSLSSFSVQVFFRAMAPSHV